MILEKSLSKMTKKELLKTVKDYQELEEKLNKSVDQLEEHNERHTARENKLKEEKQEAITALEVWKSGCLELEEANNVLQNRLTTLRKVMQLELIKTPVEEAETQEEKEGIIHSIVTKLARKLIDMEDKIKPIMHSFLPMPTILEIIQQEKYRRAKENKRAQLENSLPSGFFTN
jgi:hypothetical protein